MNTIDMTKFKTIWKRLKYLSKKEDILDFLNMINPDIIFEYVDSSSSCAVYDSKTDNIIIYLDACDFQHLLDCIKDEKSWMQYYHELCALVSHENTHKKQYNDNNCIRWAEIPKDSNDEMRYYEESTEMEAFANQCIQEYKNLNYADDDIIAELDNAQDVLDLHSEIAQMYFSYYVPYNNFKNAVRKKLEVDDNLIKCSQNVVYSRKLFSKLFK